MEETEQKTYTDKDIWKKATNINKAKYLALMGSTPQKTLWIMTSFAILIMVALMIFMPTADPQITSASQFGEKIAVLANNSRLYIADKSTGTTVKIDLNVNAISVAAGQKGLVVTNRVENKLMFFDWEGKDLFQMDVKSPFSSCFGKDWVYCHTNENIIIYKDSQQINTMPAPKVAVSRAIFEHEAVWVADQNLIWKSGPSGWFPIELTTDSKKLVNVWVGDEIKTLVGSNVSVLDLDGKPIETIKLPQWCNISNSWICDDLVSISGKQILIGSVKDNQPKIIELPK
jgi:hypothetical protein